MYLKWTDRAYIDPFISMEDAKEVLNKLGGINFDIDEQEYLLKKERKKYVLYKFNMEKIKKSINELGLINANFNPFKDAKKIYAQQLENLKVGKSYFSEIVKKLEPYIGEAGYENFEEFKESLQLGGEIEFFLR